MPICEESGESLYMRPNACEGIAAFAASPRGRLMSETSSISKATPSARYKHPEGYRLRRGRNWFFLGLTYASYYLCRYNLSPVAPELMRDLGFSRTQYGWINTGRDGAYAIGQMINGLFTDRIGGKLAMTIGAIGTIVLNLTFGLVAWSNFVWLLPTLIFVRSADGYMQAFGAPGMIKINTAWFRRQERGAFAGIFGAMINIGAVVAGLFGRYIVAGMSIPLIFFTLTVPKMDWRYIFIIPPIIVAVIVLLMNLFVKNNPEEAGYEIVHDDEPKDDDPNEKVRLRDVFRKIASNKVVWIVAAAYFCTGFVRRAVESWWAVYLHEVWDAGKESGLYTAFVWGLPATATIGSMMSGYISDLFFRGRRAPVAAMLYMAQVGFTLAALMLCNSELATGALAVTLIIGISMMCNSTHSILGTAAAMDLGGRKMAGCSSGIIDSFQYYGAMLSGAGVGKLFDMFAHGSAATTQDADGMDPRIWFATMLPFGFFGASLMGYLWWRHRGVGSAGT